VDGRSTRGIGKCSDLFAFPRGDVDVFLAPLSAFSSGCSNRFALRVSLALKTSSISSF